MPNCNKNRLILRTLAIRKDEYIQKSAFGWPAAIRQNIIEYLDDKIDEDYIWLTEISIRELFWTMSKKIGEIIVSPKTSKSISKTMVNQKSNSLYNFISLIKLPGVVCYVEESGNVEIAEFDENDSRLSLVQPDANQVYRLDS